MCHSQEAPHEGLAHENCWQQGQKACNGSRTACTCVGPLRTAGDQGVLPFQKGAQIVKGHPKRRDKHFGKFFREERGWSRFGCTWAGPSATALNHAAAIVGRGRRPSCCHAVKQMPESTATVDFSCNSTCRRRRQGTGAGHDRRHTPICSRNMRPQAAVRSSHCRAGTNEGPRSGKPIPSPKVQRAVNRRRCGRLCGPLHRSSSAAAKHEPSAGVRDRTPAPLSMQRSQPKESACRWPPLIPNAAARTPSRERDRE
jgi:hypothetical protein